MGMETAECDAAVSVQTRQNTSSQEISNPDEINLLEYVHVLVKYKAFILGFTFLGLIGGYIAAVVKGPIYVAEAVIEAKEAENQSSAPNLSSLGAFGGLVASQFNLSGNPGLDRIALILESRKFNAELIEKYDLLPEIYAQKWPDVYEKHYDTLDAKWSQEFVKPVLLGVGNTLKESFLKKDISKKTMSLRVESGDSLFSHTVLEHYLEYLNSYIQATVKTEAKDNVAYLEGQLLAVSDPLLREKLQGMIAVEMEKMMLVSKEAFKILDPPYCFKQFREKKLYPLVFAAGLFFMTALAVVFFHTLLSGQKTAEDKNYLALIKRDLRKIV